MNYSRAELTGRLNWRNFKGEVMQEMLNKIILGDCLDIMRTMPDKCVDLVLTDPPYGIGNKFKGEYR